MDEPLPKRKNLRLKQWDYATPWWYFVTICTHQRKLLFGDVGGGEMVLNDVGRMVERWWLKIPQRFEMVEFDECKIMPNHIHGIIIINDSKNVGVDPRVDLCIGDDHGVKKPNDGRTRGSAPTLGNVIQWFKTMATNNYIRNVNNKNWPRFDKRLFQRNYYEHIIRNEIGLEKIRFYVRHNDKNWETDRNNPLNF